MPLRKFKSPSNPVQSLRPGERFVTVNGAAEILDTPVNTLDFWRAMGKGPRFYKQGRNVRYLVSDLLAWGTARAVDPQQKSA